MLPGVRIVSGAAANISRMADRLPFGFRREMAKQFGYVEKYGTKGRYCVRFQHEGKIHRVTSVPVGSRFVPMTEELATECLDEMRQEIRRSGDVIAAISPYMAKSKLLAFSRRWLEFCDVQRERMETGQLSRKRYEELSGHLSRGKLSAIAEKPVHAVRYAELETLQLDLLKRGYAPKSVHHVLADVRTGLRFFERRSWIESVPEIPMTQLDEYEPTIPSKEEQTARIEAIEPEWRGYFLARGQLGVRNKEAIRADLVDYRRGPWDEETQTWRDEWSIKAKGRRFRVLPATHELATWVRAHRPALAEPGTALFPNPKNGNRISQSSMGRTWERMEKKLDLPHVKPNEALRHCFGTRTAERLIAGGMSREAAKRAVADILGHVSMTSTDRYVKLAAETLRGTIE